MSRVRIAMIVFALAALALGMFVWKKRAADERATRTTVVSVVAAPVPNGVPLAGPEGNDASGYPTQYVDRPALRSLLSHKRFADLTAYFEQFQAAFEADPTREYWPIDAGDAFASAESELLAPLTEWVTAKPDSFAPYFARGAYWANVAQERRGSKWSRETHKDNLAAMDEGMARAQSDIDKALSLRPKLVAAMRKALLVLRYDAMAGSSERAMIDGALRVCPSCFQVRVTYLYGREPRWGGSHEEMLAFAQASADPSRPRMRLLEGYVDLDEADLLRSAKKYDEATIAINRACALGDHWEFLRARAEIERDRGDLTAAIVDLDRAAVLRPGHPDVLFDRAWVLLAQRKYELAGRDLLDGLRTQPTHETGRAMFNNEVQGLLYEGWGAHTAGRHEDALRILDLANQLDPLNAEVHRRRTWVISGGGPAGTAAPEEAVAKAPDDFRAVQSLDLALAREGKFERVVALWTDYLARHPSDGPAYLERGGAYFHLRKFREAYGDASKACELGISEGCARAKQLEPALR